MPRRRSITRVCATRLDGVEEARARLPINQYLMLMHVVATRGVLLELDDNGQPLPKGATCTTDQRIDATKYLIDKVMPSYRALETALPEPDPDLQALVEPSTLANLTTEQLERMAANSKNAMIVSK
jgi:hypothetical protein